MRSSCGCAAQHRKEESDGENWGADGLTFDTERDGRRVRYRYRVEGRGFSPDEVRVNGRPLDGTRDSDNPYRPGAMLVDRGTFEGALDRPENVVDILV